MKRILIFYIFLFITAQLAAQEKSMVITMTLDEALQIARKQQPDLLNAKRNISYAEVATREAKSSYYPKLTVEGDYRYNPIIQTTVLPSNAFNPANDPKELVPIQFGTPWNGAFGLRLKQALYEPEKLATVNSSKIAVDLAKAQEKRILAEREEEIVKAWYSIMLSRAKQEFSEKDRVRNKNNEQLISEQLNTGRALATDLREAQLKTRESEINEETIGLDLFNAQVYLSYMMGYDSVQLILPKETLTLPAQVRNTEQISSLQSVVEQRPDVQEQKINADVAALQLEQTKAGRLPTINLEGFLGANNYTFNFNPITGWYGNAFVGLSVRYNLFNSGEKKSQIEQSRIELEQQKENLRKLQQQAYYEILNARRKIDNQVKQVDLQQQRLKVQEEKIEIVRSRLQEGRALPQDLLEEETKLSEIRDKLYQNLHDCLVAVAEYNRASGKNPAAINQ
ncbi:MAG TPA: TolC family protein [Chitinophagaceae bacterium]|nr:TolC family protein [Chitinophagaceae bacterium]